MNGRRWAVLLVGALAAAGCAGPEHLSDGFGGSSCVFARQAVRPPGQPAKEPVTGLDAQEAVIVAESYRRSLAAKGVRVEEEPVLFVAQPPPGAAANRLMPPPSVPQNK